jgi:hypothetical protein
MYAKRPGRPVKSEPKPSILGLPLQDQIALRLLGYMLSGANRPEPDDAVMAAYSYTNAFLEMARANYRAARAAEKEHAQNREAETRYPSSFTDGTEGDEGLASSNLAN